MAPRSNQPAKTLVDAKRLDEALSRFRAQVRSTRKGRGLDQYEAADMAGISQSQWSKIERGTLDPSLVHTLRIQAALGVPSIENFFGDHPTAAAIRAARAPEPAAGADQSER